MAARIMVVEDESIVARDIKSTLEELGYTVVAVVSSGAEALAAAAEVRPDLALMDIVLKGPLDGVQAASELRENFDIPVIYLTAYADDETLQRAALTLPLGYILKPFEERDLHKTVAMALHLREVERAEQQNRALAEALKDTAAALSSTLDAEEVLDRILANVERIVRHDRANVMLLEGELARIVRGKGYPPEMGDLGAPCFTARDLAGLRRMLDTGAPVVIPDTQDELEWVQRYDGSTTRSYAGAPIRIHGRLAGFLNLNSVVPGFYGAADAQRLQAFADQAGTAIANAQLHSQAVRTGQELQDALDAKEEIVQNISHELRTPVTQINGFTEALLEGLYGDLTAEQRGAVTIIARRTQELLRLLRGFHALHAFSPADLHMATVDVDRLLSDVAAGWAPVLADRLRMEVRLPRTTPHLLADPQALREVLDQLVNNATKFTPAGGLICLEAQAAEASARLAVSDTGQGIPAESLQRVFERFYQVRSETGGYHGGMGIGLAIVRQIIEGHGGRIWAESPGWLGSGTTFVIELPVQE